ncbi:MAG: phage major capsid protein, partial [Hyphomicrobium sp.]|uniref:phage major capsid protein n=1 Tax=Hyphomicrobium sp. TaxID=82 RepID=UPI003D0FB79F
MTTANANWSELVTSTYALRRKKVTSNVLNANVLTSYLGQRGNIVEEADGGRTLVEELSFAANSTVKWYSGYEVLDITPQTVLSAAEYPYKQMAGAITIDGLTMLQNAGKSKAISLVNSRIDNLEESMQNTLGSGVYSNGTGDGGKQIDGLALLVADAPGTGTVGGIVRDNFTFWRNQFKDANPVFSSLTAASVQALMQEVWVEIVSAPGQQAGNTGPDL